MFPLTFQVTMPNMIPDAMRLAQSFSFVAYEAHGRRSKTWPT